MKKLFGIIFVLSLCVTIATFSVTTASAETVETQDVSDTIATQELDEYNEMLDAIAKYKMRQRGVGGVSDNYSVSYEILNDKYIFVEITDNETDYGAPKVVQRNSDVVWVQNLFTSEFVVYGDGKIYKAGELYKQGKLTFEEFKKAGGAYYCDINDNDIVDVNDVTRLQLFLTEGRADMAEEFISETLGVFYDVNFDGYIDVSDVTKIQMYLAGYENVPCYGHNVVTKDYKTATCVSKGYTGDRYCEDCKTVVSKGNDIIEDKTNHINTEIRNAKEATSEDEGYTGDTYCTDCNTLISKGETIAKLPSIDLCDIEQLVFNQINEERKAAGLKSVEWDSELYPVVKIRAEEFTDWALNGASAGKAHARPDGKGWDSALEERGLSYTLCGEILVGGPNKTELVSIWMNSSGHRNVILTDEYTHVSVGIVKTKNEYDMDIYYACAIFRADKFES